jgi:hypothetical protein
MAWPTSAATMTACTWSSLQVIGLVAVHAALREGQHSQASRHDNRTIWSAG